MSVADEIRAYAVKNYIEPARTANVPQVTFTAADIHRALSLRKRYPNVCDAIGAKIFCQQNGLTVITREGPKHASTVRWTFLV